MTNDDLNNKDIGELLAEEGLITREELQSARSQQMHQEKSIGRIVVDMGYISDEEKIRFISERFGYEIVDIADMTVAPDILSRISRSYAEKYRCVPLLVEGRELVVAMENPTNIVVIDELRSQTNMKIMPVLAPIEDIDRILEEFPRMSQAQVDALRKGKTHVSDSMGRIIHTLIFFLFLLLPLLIFGAILVFEIKPMVYSFREWFQETDFYNFALYLGLSWALWAIFVWEIDGLFFQPKDEF
jgi:hypothetical protein